MAVRSRAEGEEGGGELVGALRRQKVSAAFADRAALDTVAERRDRRAQGVADAVPAAERQHGHRQPQGGGERQNRLRHRLDRRHRS
jgi:hypothetical protein